MKKNTKTKAKKTSTKRAAKHRPGRQRQEGGTTTLAGRNLQRARERKGETQMAASARLGIAQARISAIEAYGEVPKLRGALAIAKAYGVKLEDFFKDVKNTP